MKHLIAISMLLFSPVLYAQTSNPAKPATSNPNVNITPSISTTVTQQPASMPNSNTNPTTGTVIRLKAKNNSKPAAQQRTAPDSLPIVNKAVSTPPKKTSKKNKN